MGETKHSTGSSRPTSGALSRRDAERKYLQVLVADLARCIVSARETPNVLSKRTYLRLCAR